MLRTILIVVSMCAAATNALAQDPPHRLEVSGGVSFTNLEPRSLTDLTITEFRFPPGWMVGTMFFVNENTGIFVEYTQYSESEELGQSGLVDSRLRTILFGGTFVQRPGSFELPIRVYDWLARTKTASADHDETLSSMAFGAGAGLDLPLGNFGIRIFQADFIFASVAKQSFSPRIAAGAFYRW